MCLPCMTGLLGRVKFKCSRCAALHAAIEAGVPGLEAQTGTDYCGLSWPPKWDRQGCRCQLGL